MTPLASSFDAEETYRLSHESELPWVQAKVRAFAAKAGLDMAGQHAVTIAASEAVANMHRYAGGGVLVVRARLHGSNRHVEIEATDNGPGISDPEHAMLDGVSEGVLRSNALWPLRPRGLGLGLGAIRRLMSEVHITTRPGGGTVLVARKYLP